MRYTRVVARDSLGKRLAAVLVGVVLALALAEAGLQVAALVVRERARPVGPAPPETGRVGPVVLCVGDSFTYGSGSSSAATSYPSQMEAWLRANDPARAAWGVSNGGWPGRNSSEVLRKLPGFLREAHPDFVCVLAGLNNRWNMRGADDAPEDVDEGTAPESTSVAATTAPAASSAREGGAGWTWRLPRLVAIVLAALRERTDPSLRAAADSAAAAPGDVSPSDAASGRIDLTDPVAALATIRERRERTADVRPLLEALEALRPRIRALDDPKASAALVTLLADVNRYPQAEEEGRLAIERFGTTPELANALVKPLSHLARVDEAIELGRVAVAAAPDDPDRLRRLAEALRIGRRGDEALALFTRLYVMRRDAPEYEKQLRKLDRTLVSSDERCATALAGLDLSDTDRAAVTAAVRRVREEKGAPPFEEVLARDLSRMTELAREAGARLVVVGYPAPLGPLNPTLRRAADENGVPFVDVEPIFRERLRTEARERYFVPDGHCNDAGYAVVAEAVGGELLRLRGAEAAPAPGS
jgi:lysophospholipase L1-like esterase